MEGTVNEHGLKCCEEQCTQAPEEHGKVHRPLLVDHPSGDSEKEFWEGR